MAVLVVLSVGTGHLFSVARQWRGCCDGRKAELPIAEVLAGDIIIVRPGAKIPVDGVVTEGETQVDESMLTGESMPVKKVAGSRLAGATITRAVRSGLAPRRSARTRR